MPESPGNCRRSWVRLATVGEAAFPASTFCLPLDLGPFDVDINTITEVVRRPSERPGGDWRDGDAWLAGGTWLFSEQQPDLRRLIDLMPLGWNGLATSEAGLE